jgi:cytochrome c553
MSYEGYEQLICANGHYLVRDCYAPDLDADCDSCGAEIAERHCVDQTNDSGVERDIEVATEAEFAECPTCHHREQTKAATYRFKRLAGVEQDSTEEGHGEL